MCISILNNGPNNVFLLLLNFLKTNLKKRIKFTQTEFIFLEININ